MKHLKLLPWRSTRIGMKGSMLTTSPFWNLMELQPGPVFEIWLGQFLFNQKIYIQWKRSASVSPICLPSATGQITDTKAHVIGDGISLNQHQMFPPNYTHFLNEIQISTPMIKSGWGHTSFNGTASPVLQEVYSTLRQSHHREWHAYIYLGNGEISTSLKKENIYPVSDTVWHHSSC